MANLGNTIINGILRVTGPIRGNADSASKLQTPRKINGVNFDGTQDITIEAGSSGHTIINSSGTAMTQRSKLKFMNSTISDDAANDMTIITPSGITGNYLPLSGGTMTGNINFSHVNASVDGHLEWNSGTVKERITICDRTATTDPVFIFEQSRDSGSSYPALLTINGDGEIVAKTFTGALSGNASTATTLQTARTINGTSFNGSANITTANWGTARNIGIVNSDGTGTAITTFVNGSANINLKLPATIKATLDGNAATATILANARTINGTSFNGSANITTANWGTSRNITIQDATAAHSGTAVAVNGSANVNLKLPSTITAALSGNASTATKLQTARTIGLSGVTATAKSFDGSANITIPITAIPATLLTNKTAIKASEITNDKHWIPSSDNSVTNFVSMTEDEFNTNSSTLPNGTIVAVTTEANTGVTTTGSSITCELPLDL